MNKKQQEIVAVAASGLLACGRTGDLAAWASCHGEKMLAIIRDLDAERLRAEAKLDKAEWRVDHSRVNFVSGRCLACYDEDGRHNWTPEDWIADRQRREENV